MDRIVDRLPSPAGFALWLYALVFVILPAALAWKGFAYIAGTVIFAVGVHPNIENVVAGRPIPLCPELARPPAGLGLPPLDPERTPGDPGRLDRPDPLHHAGRAVLLFIVQQQGQIFYRQIESQLPEILDGINAVMTRLGAWRPAGFRPRRQGRRRLVRSLGHIQGALPATRSTT